MNVFCWVFCGKGVGLKGEDFYTKRMKYSNYGHNWTFFCRFLDYCAVFFCCLMTSTDSPAISQGTLALSHLHSYKKSITTTTITKYVLDNKIILRWIPHPPIYRIFSTFYLHKSAAIVSKSRYMCNFFCTSTLIGICSSSHGSCLFRNFVL